MKKKLAKTSVHMQAENGPKKAARILDRQLKGRLRRWLGL
jgi:hypothetical protein